MSIPSSHMLDQASQFIQEGELRAARSLLADYLRENPLSDRAWYLLSMVTETDERKIECLLRAVNLNPGNIQAQNRLKQLIPPRQTSTTPATFEADTETPSTQYKNDQILAGQMEEHTDYTPWEPLDPINPERKKASIWMKSKSLLFTGTFGLSGKSETRHGVPTWLVWMVIGLSVLTVLVCFVGGIVLFHNRAEADRLALLATRNFFPTLPPTWTPTPQPPPSVTPTPAATPIPTSTPTIPAPAPTILAQMDRIQKQVAVLRGLKVETQVPSYLIAPQDAKEMLAGSLLNEDGRNRLHNLARALTAFGFIKPTYDLTNFAINAAIDSSGGFFEPNRKEIYVLGLQFAGMERYVYTHEFDHALIDRHFLSTEMGIYPPCQLCSDRCSAIHALVEGDATLLMNKWLRQYAGPEDLRVLADYQPPAQAFPEDFTPQAIKEDLLFPYQQGEAFVQKLYNKGKWAAVNQAYESLPETTEQILHPEKYDSHEPAIAVPPISLDAQLGTGWSQIASDVFGEWNTYLMLAYGADTNAQLIPDVAQKAAEGWGGDRYQLYLNSESNQTALAIDWVWDSPQDADEFTQAMENHLDALFHGDKFDHAKGKCWQANEKTTCLFQASNAILWLLTPDMETSDKMLAGYTAFQ
jgi:hypothetical protein